MASETSTMLLILEAQNRASAGMDEVRDKLLEVAAAAQAAATSVSDAGKRIDASLAETAVEARAVGDANTQADDAVKKLGDDLKNEATGSDTWQTHMRLALQTVTDGFDRLAKILPLVKTSSEQAAAAQDKNAKSTAGAGKAAQQAASQGSDLAGKIRLIALATGALAGPIAGILALGPVALFGGMAAGAALLTSSINKANQSGQQLSQTQQALLPTVKVLDGAFQQLQPAVNGAFQGLSRMVTVMGPQLGAAAHALAPMISVIANGLDNLLANLIGPLSQMMQGLMPVVVALGNGLGTLGKGLAGLFTNLNIQAAAQGLAALFNTIGAILPALGSLIGALSPLSNVIMTTLLPAIGQVIVQVAGALKPAILALIPIMGPLAGTIATLAQTFGQVLTAIVPLLPPILGIVLAFSNFDTPLEMIANLFGALAKALAPVIGLVAQIANLVANFLNTAITNLAGALIPLIPPLGQLADDVLQALLQVLTALGPGLNAMVNVLVALLPSLIPVIDAVARLVVDLTPLVTMLAKVASWIVTTITPALSHLGPVVTIVAGAIVAVTLAMRAWSVIMAIVNVLLDANPIMLIVIALVGLGLAVIACYQHFQGFRNVVSDVMNWFKGPFVNAFEDVGKWFTGPFVGFFVDVGRFFTTTVPRYFHDAVTAVEGIVRGWYPVIIGILSGGILLLPALIFKYWDQIAGFIGRAWNDALNVLSGIPGKVWDAIKGTYDDMVTAGKNIIIGLINGVESMLGKLGDVMKSVASTVTSIPSKLWHMLSPSKVFHGMGLNIVQGLVNGIADNLDLVRGVSTSLALTATGTVQTGLTAPAMLAAAGAGGARAGGGAYVDLRGSFFTSQQAMAQLVQMLGRYIATDNLPSGGLKVAM